MPKVLDEDQLRRKKELERKRAARKAAKLAEKQSKEVETAGTAERQSKRDGPSPLLDLPDVALHRILIYLSAEDLGKTCATCQRLDRLLTRLRVPHILSRAGDLIKDSTKASTAIERSYRGDTDRLVLKNAKVPREYVGYARFLEQAISGYTSLRASAEQEETLLPKFSQGRFVSVSPEHSVCRVNNIKGVATCGVGNRGQLGHNERVDVRIPKEIVGLGSKIVQVSAGGGLVRVAHTLLLTNTGRVLSFGTGQYGALGHGFSAAKQLPDVLQPTPIQALRHVTVTNVSAGELHSACVTSDGDVYTWGDGFCGQLGHGDKRPQLVPKQIECGGLDDEIVANITCGARHTLAVTEDGQVYSWGLGHFGALGRTYTPFEYDADSSVGQFGALPDDESEVEGIPPEPAAVVPPESVSAPQPSVDSEPQAEAMDPELVAHLDLIANLTLDDSSDQCVPKVLDALDGVFIVGASAGHRHSLVLSDQGRLYSFGTGSGGCLGHGDAVSQRFPLLISSFLDDNIRIRQMSAGVDISMAVSITGQVYAWGLTRGGRIGIDNGIGSSITLPRSVVLQDKQGENIPAIDVECGYVHGLIVGLDGTVHLCGGVGIEGQADGGQEGGGLPSQVPNMNLWHRLGTPTKAPVAKKERWKRYGRYEVRGRSRMMSSGDD